jgi:hypothetical protein
MVYSKILRFLAVICRVYVEQNIRHEGGASVSLQQNLMIQSKFLSNNFLDPQPLGQNYLKKLTGNFYFTGQHASTFFRNIQLTCTDLGLLIAGDEKLFDYTGALNDVRKVPIKPGKGIGPWYYELCAITVNDCPLLILVKPRLVWGKHASMVHYVRVVQCSQATW